MSSPVQSGPNPTGNQGRRRSSNTRLFENLHNMKRSPDNEAYAARRLSISEQMANKPGFFGNMWHNYTRGPASPSPKK